MKILKSSLICAAFALFSFACSENKTPQANSTNIVVANTNAATLPAAASPAAELADARALYERNCANCHKADGTGGKKEIEGKIINPDNLTTDKMKNMADDKYFDYIKNGVPDEGMPAFKNQLTDEQIKSVITFIRTEFQRK